MIKNQSTCLQSFCPVPASSKKSIPFLIVVSLFGLGLGFTLNILDPFIYAEKIRLLTTPALKNSILGSLTIVALLVALVAQPVMGWLSDRTRSRWGKRAPYLTGGVIGVSFSLVFIVVADSLWLLVLGVIFLSAFSNTTQGAWQALVPDQVPRSQRGTAAGIKTILELIGVVAGVAVVGTALARGYMWGAPLIAMALSGIILLITLFALGQTTSPSVQSVRDATCHASKEPEQRSGSLYAWPGLSFLRQMPDSFLWWMLNRALFWAAMISIRTFMLNYMEDVLGMPPTEAQVLSSRLFVVLGLGVFICALPAGAIADRIGRRPLLIVAGLMAAMGAISLVFFRDLPLLFVAGGLIAIGAGIFASASWALATDLVPTNQGAHYLGLANVATILGSISGRLGGLLIDGLNQLTGTITVGYLIDFSLAALLFAASSLVVFKIVNR